jgi:hypothetical protein
MPHGTPYLWEKLLYKAIIDLKYYWTTGSGGTYSAWLLKDWSGYYEFTWRNPASWGSHTRTWAYSYTLQPWHVYTIYGTGVTVLDFYYVD